MRPIKVGVGLLDVIRLDADRVAVGIGPRIIDDLRPALLLGLPGIPVRQLDERHLAVSGTDKDEAAHDLDALTGGASVKVKSSVSDT